MRGTARSPPTRRWQCVKWQPDAVASLDSDRYMLGDRVFYGRTEVSFGLNVLGSV